MATTRQNGELEPTALPSCECGELDWSIDHRTEGTRREVRILQCGGCGQVGVAIDDSTTSYIDYIGAVDI